MKRELRLACVLAHPDDESLGAGPIIAKYAAQGIPVAVVCATRGERGWTGDAKDNPGLDALGKTREAELRAAADLLGVRELHFLNHIDGDLNRVDPQQVIGQVAHLLRAFRPDVVLTFDPFGAYGHPDHVAICQFTMAAIVEAAKRGETGAAAGAELAPHTVSKLYYMADTRELTGAFEELAGELVMDVDGTMRRNVYWPQWAISTVIDAPDEWERVWLAVQCHDTQRREFELLTDAPKDMLKLICSRRTLFRAFSLVNGGAGIETDVFEGLA